MYSIQYANKRVKKNLKKFPKSTAKEIISELEKELRNFPRVKNIAHVKETGHYRWKKGDFRAAFKIDKKKKILTVYHISTRQSFYKKIKRKQA